MNQDSKERSWESLRFLVSSLIGTVLLASVGLGLLFNQVYDRLSLEPHKDEYQREKNMLESLRISYQTSADKQQFLGAWRNSEYVLSLTSKINFPLPNVLETELSKGEILVLESEEGISLHRLLPGSNQVLTLDLPQTKQESNESLRYWLTSLFYLCLLTLVLVWLYPLMMRLLHLRKAAQQFGGGDFQTRVSVGKISYIADIESEFNRMAQKIENLVSDIKLLSSAVSHDLRTPLARIRFGVETMAEEEDQSQREYFQQRIIDDVDEMVDLVEHLLDFSRLEKQLLQAENESINLISFVPALVKQCQHQTVNLQVVLPEDEIYLNGSRHFIAMLINNLLGNACKFAKSKVLVILVLKGQSILLSVEDDGKGVSERKREEILKPFVRDTETNDEKGYGLGLAVVKRVSEFYGGQISVATSEHLGGAAFQVSFLCK